MSEVKNHEVEQHETRNEEKMNKTLSLINR
jgi:hypothetical protein